VISEQQTLEEYERSLKGLDEIDDIVSINKAPKVKVRFEKDKLLCVLWDAISFEPDIIKSISQPRIHYFDPSSGSLRIHNLQTQVNDIIPLPQIWELPKNFSSIQAHNTIYIIGGEENNEGGIFEYSKKVFTVDENSFELV